MAGVVNRDLYTGSSTNPAKFTLWSLSKKVNLGAWIRWSLKSLPAIKSNMKEHTPPLLWDKIRNASSPHRLLLISDREKKAARKTANTNFVIIYSVPFTNINKNYR